MPRTFRGPRAPRGTPGNMLDDRKARMRKEHTPAARRSARAAALEFSPQRAHTRRLGPQLLAARQQVTR